jgi:hypothetical protein
MVTVTVRRTASNCERLVSEAHFDQQVGLQTPQLSHNFFKSASFRFLNVTSAQKIG